MCIRDRYVTHFEKFLTQGKDVLHVTLSSGISGTYGSACAARDQLAEKYPDRKVVIVDSLCASAGYGLLMDRLADLRDTGMGIAAEDLPRIFEQGFTGVNGRRDRRASGIGLYLCRRICGNLGHTIRASSVPNQGTEIRIGLGQKKTLPE